MNKEYLEELLGEVSKRGGGLVLNSGENPEAVVLSIEKYYQLLQGGLEPVSNMLTSSRVEEKVLPTKIRTVLVTGGAGYIGSHVVRLLLAENYTPIVLDNLSTGKREYLVDGVTFYEGNTQDAVLLKRIFSEHAVEAVIHLAASLEVAESVEFPEKYIQNNVGGTLALLIAMSEAEIKTIVFSSTAAVYGNQDKVPIHEDAICEPVDPYGYSKLTAEQSLRYFSKFKNIRVTVLRYFNVCGSTPAWGIIDTHAKSHLVPVILEVASGKREKIMLNGTDYPTSDGSCVRDYVHVLDIARAHLAALKRDTGDAFRVYNVGTGHGSSVKEMISVAAEVTNRMIPMEIGPRRPGDAIITVADTARIKSELNFKTEHSSLENIFSSYWASISKLPEVSEVVTKLNPAAS